MRAAVVAVTLIAALTLVGCGDNLMPVPTDPDAGEQPDGDPADAAIDAVVPDARPPETVCNDNIDNDEDGDTDCADEDCGAVPGCIPEMVCNDGLDDDLDTFFDCDDSDCATAAVCLPEGLCQDATDNDEDGNADCADSDCALACLTSCPDGDTVVVVPGEGIPSPINDALTVDLPLEVNATATALVRSGAVAFSVTHTYTGDLDISLRTPTAATLDLTSDNGSSGDNYTATILVDTATDLVSDGTAPYTGLYRPEQPFVSIAGLPADGTWRFIFDDDAGGDEGTVDAAVLYLCLCDGSAGCEVGVACLDGEDNDGDTLVDCDDPDCGNVAQCIPESECDDATDNDLDTLTDCADPDCDGIGTCEQPEASCFDGIDNDADGILDCSDTDCVGLPLCSAETDCTNGTDDDGDGLTDCLDPGCDGVMGCQLGSETACDDGFDNDGDGATDCDDDECDDLIVCQVVCPSGYTSQVFTSPDVPKAIPDSMPIPATVSVTLPAGPRVVTAKVQMEIDHTYDADLDIFLDTPTADVTLSTDNGGSGDDFISTIFSDDAPTSITAGAAPFTGQFRPQTPLAAAAFTDAGGPWTLQVSDDAGGDIGAILAYSVLACTCDPTTDTNCELGPALCRDGANNDGDALVDCADPDCATDPSCLPEPDCDDGADNDFDGATDCDDSDCDGVSGCEFGAEVTCDDAFDNDSDGVTDCDDASCDGLDACEFGTELTCADGFDNDSDGVTDCFDPDCVADVACLAETVCDDGIDDDGDTFTDCTDPDCAADVNCLPETDCTNGTDDDGDGETDCLDLGCDGLQGCELGAELSCEDGFDNDGDGQTDCADAANCGTLFQCSLVCPSGMNKVLRTATDLPQAIPDGGGTTTFALSSIAVPTVGLVTGVALRVNVTHPFDGDVDIALLAPGGTIDVSTDNGSGGDNYTNTVFVDTATTAITSGSPPYTGRFRPEQAFSTLNPTLSAGAWNLRVGDDAGGDVGSLTGYELLTCECDAASGNCEFGAVCTNGLDDDGDGLSDCADPNCVGSWLGCAPREHACSDTADDDGDGQVDCADSDCAWACTALACGGGQSLYVYNPTDLPESITTVGTPTLTSSITVPASITGTIASSAVRFSATHTWDSDITLDLASPMATLVDLTSGNGSSGDNYNNTVLVDTAATAVTAGTAPFAGTFRPEQPLAGFTAQPFAGTWTARLRDTANGDGGSWNDFALAACVAP
jgi:subtilisin-like proprotein convertase family protein